jgi:hypothetical protein
MASLLRSSSRPGSLSDPASPIECHCLLLPSGFASHVAPSSPTDFSRFVRFSFVVLLQLLSLIFPAGNDRFRVACAHCDIETNDLEEQKTEETIMNKTTKTLSLPKVITSLRAGGRAMVTPYPVQ